MMKKFFFYSAAFVVGIIALCLLVPVGGLLISGLLIAAGLHFYIESKSKFGKLLSIVIAVAGLMTALSNIPGFIGLAALGILYYMYKARKNETAEIFAVKTEEDPFTNFEREWANLNK